MTASAPGASLPAAVPERTEARAPGTLAGSHAVAALAVTRAEVVALGAIMAAAAVLRFVNLPLRSEWDADQGNQMLAVWSALKAGQVPQLGPLSSIGTFHHGALTYDLWLPAAWLGNGDPTAVVIETGLLGLLVVPLLWWVARSIGGRAAGLITALLAAVSASLIGYSIYVWNPTLIEPGAAIAVFGAWQAWRSRRPGWWLLAAAGLAIVMQAHVAGPMLAIPIVAAYGAALWRGPGGQRRRLVGWGIASAALVAVTYLPFLAYELGHGFAETRAILAYFGSPSSTPRFDPFTRLFLGATRILAWPLTRWPLVDFRPAFIAALTVAACIATGIAWRVSATRASSRRAPADAAPTAAAVGMTDGPPTGSEPARDGARTGPRRVIDVARSPLERDEHDGVRLVAGGLLILILVLSLGLRNVSEVQELPTEQYHAAADPLAIVAAGLVLGALWSARRAWRALRLGPVVGALAVVALVAWNAVRWPPLAAADGGWPAAQAAARQIERDAGGGSIAIVSLPAIKWPDAYGYPLVRDGITLVTPESARTVVVLCDSFWVAGCGGAAEQAWLANAPGGSELTLVERFSPAPQRTLTVFRRGP